MCATRADNLGYKTVSHLKIYILITAGSGAGLALSRMARLAKICQGREWIYAEIGNSDRHPGINELIAGVLESFGV